MGNFERIPEELQVYKTEDTNDHRSASDPR